MPRIIHMRNADLILEVGLTAHLYYWFDENQCVCIRTNDASNSYILIDAKSDLVKDALDAVKRDNVTVEDGSIPGYFECECGDWTADGDSERWNNLKLCLSCHDYEYRRSLG
jgi:hypothetical protein